MTAQQIQLEAMLMSSRTWTALISASRPDVGSTILGDIPRSVLPMPFGAIAAAIVVERKECRTMGQSRSICASPPSGPFRGLSDSVIPHSPWTRSADKWNASSNCRDDRTRARTRKGGQTVQVQYNVARRCHRGRWKSNALLLAT